MTQELNGFLSVSVGLMMKAEKTLKVNLYCMVGETDILEATLEGNSHITLYVGSSKYMRFGEPHLASDYT